MSSSKPHTAVPTLDPAIVQNHLEDGAQGNPGRKIPDVPLIPYFNHTPFPSQYFQSVDQNGDVFHVVALRVTYEMGHTLPDGSLAYAAEQTPLATKDEWSDVVNDSSPLWESDYAPFKPKCDVLVVNAVSRPPQGQAAQRWPCGVVLKWQQDGQATTWDKQLTVTGSRRFGMLSLSQPEATREEVAILWQNAYGGQDKRPHADEYKADGTLKKAAGSDHWKTDERNPVGAGFNKASGQPGPQLEVFGKPYTDGLGQADYPPVCLSAVGRAWLPRRTLAGTYDNDWLKNQWPLPPLDFDSAYWNAAPQDQQVEHLPPGTQILLVNLYPPSVQQITAQGHVATTPKAEKQAQSETWQGKLPEHQLWLGMVAQFDGEPPLWIDNKMKLDALVIDLAAQQIYATYRITLTDPGGTNLRLLELRNAITPAGHPEKTLSVEDFGPLWR